MSSIKYDSELMTNYVSALPVPPSSHYVTCIDPSSRRPMVFTISLDAKLLAVKEDGNGQNILIDIGQIMGISSSTPVQAFDCAQATDLSIYLCVAVSAGPTTSNIIITAPFNMSLAPTIRTLPSHAIGTVQRLYIGSPDAGHGNYPMILATHQPSDRMTDGSDISRIMVTDAITDWYILRDMELPVNAARILDIAPAANAYGQGLYALISLQGTIQIIGEFARPDLDQDDGSLFWYTCNIQCPDGATSIATVTDGFGRTALLVSCSAGLQYFTCWEATNRNYPGRTISNHSLFKQSSQLEVAQDGGTFTVWAISSQKEFGYQTMSIGTTPTLVSQPTLFLPAGLATGFSASASSSFPSSYPSPNVKFQTIIVNDASGNLTLFEQFSDTGIWQNRPFYFASTADNVPVTSYTVTLTGFDSSGNPVGNGILNVASSSYTNVICNGNPVTLTPSGTDFILDPHGELAFIIATDSMSCPVLKITNLKSTLGAGLFLPLTYCDPSRKAIQGLANIKTGSDLTNAKTQNGKGLFDDVTTPDNDTLNKVADAFSQLYTAVQGCNADGTYPVPPPPAPSGPNDFLWDPINYTKHAAGEIKDWAVQTVNGVLQLVCNIAGEVKKFILSTVEKICEGVTWLWSKINLGIEIAIEYLGFLFDWQDIIATKRTIKSLVNGALSYGSRKAKSIDLNSSIDNFFAPLLSDLRVPDTLPAEQIDAGDHKNDPGASFSQRTSIKWTGERLKNGGASSGSQVSDSDVDIVSELDALFESLASSLSDWDTLISSIGTDISALFSGSVSLSDVLAKIGQTVLIQFINAVKSIIKAFTTVISTILDWTLTLGNKKINIPIISALYKLIAEDDLTVFDAVCFILAIPMTIITKLITNSAPPQLPDIDDNFCATYFFGDGIPPTSPSAAPQAKGASLLLNRSVSNAKQDTTLQATPAASVGSMDPAVQAKIATFIKGLTSVSSLLVPLVSTFNVFYNVAKTQWADTTATIYEVIATNFLPMRAIRIIALTVRLISSVASFIGGDPARPGRNLRYAAAVVSGTRAITGFCTLAAMPSTATGFANKMKSQVKAQNMRPEDIYEVVACGQGVINLVLYSVVYDQELKSNADVWKDYSQERTVLGIIDNTLAFAGNMGNRVAYVNIRRDGDPKVTAGAMLAANVIDAGSTECKLAHWVRQVQAGALPSLTESGGGE